jgi:hypothetical protein
MPALGCLTGLGLLALSGCAEEQVGPVLSAPDPDATPRPEDLVSVFDCLNSEGAFDALAAPLNYMVDQDYLDPYFLVPGYLDPLHLDENIQGGDISLTVQSLDQLLNDPDRPLDALLAVYMDLWSSESAFSTPERRVSHLEALLKLSLSYTDYLYENCTTDSCPLLDIAQDLYNSPAVEVLKENSAATAEKIDPELADDLARDLLSVVKQSTSASTGDDNLLLGLTASMIIDPAPADPYKTVDDPYVASGDTLLESLQQPLCQLRSDRDTLDALSSGGGGSSDTLSYLPLYLRTLNNYNPGGAVATTLTDEQTASDADLDGFTLGQGDCNDADAAIYPRAVEAKDRKDNDCDLVVDGELDNSDQDGDGVTPNQGDCNDADPSIHPYVKISKSDGSVIVIQAAAELDASGNGDLKDNDCDGFVDQVPSSLSIVLEAGKVMLPSIYAPYKGVGSCTDSIDNDGDGNIDGADANCASPAKCSWGEASEYGCSATTLNYLVATMAANAALTSGDISKMLDQFSDFIEPTLSNYSNGVLSPELTAQARVAIPVVYQMADLGLLSSSSTAALGAINGDHLDYKKACIGADGLVRSSCQPYRNACGEANDPYVDTLTVLSNTIELVDAYSMLDEPHLNALLPIVINSDLLVDLVKVVPLTKDENGQTDPAVMDAMLELFDYFIAPPEGSGLYADNYAAARLWTVMPMAGLLYADPLNVDEVDALMTYAIDGIEDPNSALAGLPDALEALSQVQTGATVNTDALIQALLDPGGRYILVNALPMASDPNLIDILVGDWDALPDEVEAKYRPSDSESTFAFFARWIEEGVVDTLIDMGGDLLSWVVNNTGLVAAGADEPDATPTPAPTPTPTPQ